MILYLDGRSYPILLGQVGNLLKWEMDTSSYDEVACRTMVGLVLQINV